MKRLKAASWISTLSAVYFLMLPAGGGAADVRGTAPGITVASYYFGQYHPNDPRNLRVRGRSWSEWELVKAAKPRFPGHQQPKVPLWGYQDESDPRVMAGKIAAAADHGIDVFIFDWYHYDDGPFLDRPIDAGFLRATNHHRLKFALMWANHDWIQNLFPYKKGDPQQVLYPGKVSPANFKKICEHVIRDYFAHPSYWKLDGRPYFSFYDLTKLLDNFGSIAATRAGLDEFRAQAKAAGLPGMHLNAVAWGQPILPGEKVPVDSARLVRELGFDSVTSYVWVHHVALPEQATDYDVARDGYFAYWDKATKIFSAPYIPNISMGWDPSPRCEPSDSFDNSGYPFTHTIQNNTPEKFRVALERASHRLLEEKGGLRIVNINCWNEWTEGSYLEPNTVNGLKYLEAVREVFGVKGEARQAHQRLQGDDPPAAGNVPRPRMLWADPSRDGRLFSKDPAVIEFGGHSLLYYSMPPSTNKAAAAGWGIGIAESRDLVSWAKVGEVLPEQECESRGICAPEAIVLGGKVHLFYQTYGGGRLDALCHAVSEDGLQFGRDPSNPVFRPTGEWNCGRAIDGEAFAVGDELFLYFATRDPEMKVQMLGVASAELKSDFSRKTWQQRCGKPILAPELPWEKKCIEAPTVTRRGNMLYMFYAGGYNNDPQQIGCASSTDGLRWTRLFREPLIPNGAPGEWNASETGHPGVFEASDGHTYLFVQGNNDKGRTWFLSCYEIGWRDQAPFVIWDSPKFPMKR